jgi:HD-GYP domain-containing protein (c-di-GMP phosphodiesterase class II)
VGWFHAIFNIRTTAFDLVSAMSEVQQSEGSEKLKGIYVPLSELVLCVSSAMDLMCEQVAQHNIRVAGIAAALGAHMDLPDEHVEELVIAGALHDIGAFSLQDRLDTLSFEAVRPEAHAAAGAALLATFPPFDRISQIVRHHHKAWMKGTAVRQHDIPFESFVLHLADRVEVQMRSPQTILEDSQEIKNLMQSGAGDIFHPDIVDAFQEISERESFWLEAISPNVEELFERKGGNLPLSLDSEMLFDFGLLITRFIDFRSRFTSVHSRGVAATAEKIAELAGFSEYDRTLMRLAGYLHDLGKLVVPSEIIEKPASLSNAERCNVKRHTFYTHRLLGTVGSFDRVNIWAALHHERMDGTGYPFRYKDTELPQGARIMAVADVFTALTEDRPYRPGMRVPDALALMREMAAGRHLDPSIVALASRHMENLNQAREDAQCGALDEYARFVRGLAK